MKREVHSPLRWSVDDMDTQEGRRLQGARLQLARAEVEEAEAKVGQAAAKKELARLELQEAEAAMPRKRGTTGSVDLSLEPHTPVSQQRPPRHRSPVESRRSVSPTRTLIDNSQEKPNNLRRSPGAPPLSSGERAAPSHDDSGIFEDDNSNTPRGIKRKRDDHEDDELEEGDNRRARPARQVTKGVVYKQKTKQDLEREAKAEDRAALRLQKKEADLDRRSLKSSPRHAR